MTSAPSASDWLSSYPVAADGYDELRVEPGSLRPHWQPFIRSLESLGKEELTRRWESARRMIRDHGVSYNVYGDPRGMDRPWELDTVPWLIPEAEWISLERALAQRAQLLNLVLADLYGEQRLLAEGLIPPSLVFGNPGFLRPCHGQRLPGGTHLHLYAADLARSPDGRWWVVADYTQAPAGAGYALENRIVLSRTLAEVFRGCQVQRLARFFSTLRRTLALLAPQAFNPRVVLLTPGPRSEGYFEHAFLARYLGYNLVEGGDLTVRDNRVFLKTLEGLQPVDVILRRLTDDFCDPLELRDDSLLGVAGLVEAVYAGNVAIANALGSGLLETPAIMAFLPPLSQRLLSEELMMPSLATWWCGQPQAAQYVVDHLEQLIVKPTYAGAGREPIRGAGLEAAQKQELLSRLQGRPHEFVAQEPIVFSTVPRWAGDALQPAPVVLRAYAVAAGDSYAVMPGGLTRMFNMGEMTLMSRRDGVGSKDTWVLAHGPVKPFSLLAPPSQPVQIQRATTDLPSRTADNLYWLGRYAERAEEIARLLRSVLGRVTYESAAAETPEISSLLQILDSLGLLYSGFRPSGKEPLQALERELLSQVFKQQRRGSLRETLNRLHRVAWLVRTRLSSDTWRILNQLHEEVARVRAGSQQLDDALALLNRIITALAAFSGMEMENMTRGHGWRFLDIGRRLERSVQMIHLLRTMLAERQREDTSVLDTLLEVADSSMTYRARYFSSLQLAPALDLLLKDESNPRSLAFQLGALAEHIEVLPRDPSCPMPSREQQIIRQAVERVRQADPSALSNGQAQGLAAPLENLLVSLSADLRSLSDTLTYYYFSHAERPQQPGPAWPQGIG